MSLPDDYIAALGQLSLAFEAYRTATGGDAVLVGGGATAIYTAGEFQSGDFDIVAADDAEFDAAMHAHGFIKEHRAGHLMVGYYHPGHLAYGFQQVSGALFDGRSDRAKIVHMLVKPHGVIALPSVEDMIADRLGQHAVASPSDASRLLQARALFSLGQQMDLTYLIRRVLEEGGDPSLLGLHLER